MALSPDEKTLVTLGDEVIAWDTATGKRRWQAMTNDCGFRLPGAAYGIHAIAFTSDSQEFYTPGRTGGLIIWETRSGRHQDVVIDRGGDDAAGPAAFFAGRSGDYRSIEVTADGQMALGSAGGILVIHGNDGSAFEIENHPHEMPNQNRDRLQFGGPYGYVRFAPDGRNLAVVTSDNPEFIRIIDAKDGQQQRRIPLKSRLVRMDFSPDGKQIVTTERDSAVRMYDVRSARPLWSQVLPLNDPHENYTSAVAFSPNGNWVGVCATDYKIRLLDALNGAQITEMKGHVWYPWSLAFTADSKMLYSSGWDGAVRRWDLAAHKQMELPQGVWGSEVVAASPDGRTAAYQDGWGAIRIVDADRGVELRKFDLPGTRYAQLTFSPDGRQLAGGGGEGGNNQVTVWDMAAGKVVHRWEWPRGRDPKSTVEALQFSYDGSRLAAGVFRQSFAYLWDLTTGEQIAELPHKSIYGLSFGPTGELATAGWDSTVRLWDGQSGKIRQEIDLKPVFPDANDLRMYTVCYAPQGGLLATAHLDATVHVWQADRMTLQSQFAVDGRFVYGAVSFSPDGLWLATGSMNGNVALYDAASGDKVWSVGKHLGHVYHVDFGRNSQSLLTGGADGVGYQWDLRPTEPASGKTPAALWDDLAGDDGTAAYRAMWELAAAADDAVDLLGEKLRPVKDVVDPNRATEGEMVEENLRQQILQKRLAAGEPDVQSELTLRRALALLAQIDTPAAVQLLKDLAAQGPTSDLGRLAAAALQWTGSTK